MKAYVYRIEHVLIIVSADFGLIWDYGVINGV